MTPLLALEGRPTAGRSVDEALGFRPPGRASLEWFVVDEERELAALYPEWRRLARLASPSVFGSPEWSLTW
jgi:hypothetical protein